MNIRDLKYIITVAKEQHFARAAAKVFVSQPTLSMQIKKLEDELGAQIFERSNKNFLVTKVGKEIIKKAERIKGGDILVFHDSSKAQKNLEETLETIILMLQKRNFHFNNSF